MIEVVTEIPGLSIARGALSPNECKEMLDMIQSRTWSTALARRTQHYGYNYEYKSRSLRPVDEKNSGEYSIDQLPLPTNCSFEPAFELAQGIVNEYKGSQFISPHIDAPCFGEQVMTISLGDATNFIMTRGSKVGTFLLEEGDMVLLEGEARKLWHHSTEKQTKKPEFYRVSLTCRSLAALAS